MTTTLSRAIDQALSSIDTGLVQPNNASPVPAHEPGGRDLVCEAKFGPPPKPFEPSAADLRFINAMQITNIIVGYGDLKKAKQYTNIPAMVAAIPSVGKDHQVWVSYGNLTAAPVGNDWAKSKHRKTANCTGVDRFYLDFDGDPTGSKNGKPCYTTTDEVLAAAKVVFDQLSLSPTFIFSGSYIQGHIVLDQVVSVEDWLPAAEQLKGAIAALDPKLAADTNVWTNPVAFGRIPGTLNHKHMPPTRVKVVEEGATATFDQVVAAVQGYAPITKKPASPTSNIIPFAANVPEHIKRLMAKRGHARNTLGVNSFEIEANIRKAIRPEIAGEPDLDPRTRGGCQRFALILGGYIKRGHMAETTARAIYHEYAKLDPEYGVKPTRSPIENDKFIDAIFANTDPSKAPTIGTLRHALKKLGVADIELPTENDGRDEDPSDAIETPDAPATFGTIPGSTPTPPTPPAATEWPNPTKVNGLVVSSVSNIEYALDTKLGITMAADPLTGQVRLSGCAPYDYLNDASVNHIAVKLGRLGLNVFDRTVASILRERENQITQQTNQQRMAQSMALATPTLSLQTPEYAVKGVLSPKTVSVVYGQSGSGKTFFVMRLAFAMTLGQGGNAAKPLTGFVLGKRVQKTAVVYVCLEGYEDFNTRLVLHNNIYGDPFTKNMFGRVNLPICLSKDNGDDSQNRIIGYAEQIKQLSGCKQVAVIIDTLSRSMPGADENSSGEMSALMSRCKVISDATGAAVILIHHSGKDTTKGMRGSTAIYAACDTVVQVANVDKWKGEKLTPGVRSASVEKSKGGSAGRWINFNLKQHSIGTDSDGDAVTSCTVEELTDTDLDNLAGIGGLQVQGVSVAPKGHIEVTGGAAKVLEHIIDTMSAGGTPGLPMLVPEGKGLTEIRAVSVEELRESFAGECPTRDQVKARKRWDAKRKSATRAIEKLCHDKVIEQRTAQDGSTTYIIPAAPGTIGHATSDLHEYLNNARQDRGLLSKLERAAATKNTTPEVD